MDTPTSVQVEQVLESGGVPEGASPSHSNAPDTDIRDLLSSAFKDDAGKPAAQADGTSNEGPARDDKGRFAPKVEDGSTPAVAAPAADPNAPPAPAADPNAPPAPAAAPTEIVPVPRTMSFADAQQFTSLPVEMQQFVARTLESVEQRASQYADYDAIEQLVAPRREALALNGESVPAALNRLLAYSDFAGRDPEAYVAWFAEQHGMDLAALADGQPAIDRDYRELQATVHGLQQQLRSMTEGQQNAALEANRNDVQAFASEAGTDGKPLRPYYSQLANSGELGACVVAVKEQNPTWNNRQVLEEAYNRACWANPTTRQTLNAANTAAQEAERLAAARAHAGRAAEASVALNGAPRGAPAGEVASGGDGTVRGELRAAFAAASGDV